VNVALAHHLPTGGAVRVLAEWAARTSASHLTVYTRDASVHEFAALPRRARVVERPLHQGVGMLDEVRRLTTSPRDGKALAAEIDAAGHDVVLCCASRLTQALDVLPFLRTPSVFYDPEPLRSAVEPRSVMYAGPGWRAALSRADLNPLEWRRRALDRRYVRAAPRVITHSQYTRAALHDAYGIDSDVVLLAVDHEAFTPGGERDGHVLAVGALHPLKGHDLVIDAVAAIPAGQRPPLVVVGDRGEIEGELRAQAAAAGVALDLRRGLPFGDVVELYRRAAVVACGQVREPFGLVPLEAMACATPVVAVDEGGFRETVRDGETGLLVARDAAAMGAAIARVLGDRQLAGRLGAAGRADVEARWTWDRVAAEFDAHLAAAAASVRG